MNSQRIVTLMQVKKWSKHGIAMWLSYVYRGVPEKNGTVRGPGGNVAHTKG